MAWYHESASEPKHFDFLRRQMDAFNNAGGTICEMNSWDYPEESEQLKKSAKNQLIVANRKLNRHDKEHEHCGWCEDCSEWHPYCDTAIKNQNVSQGIQHMIFATKNPSFIAKNKDGLYCAGLTYLTPEDKMLAKNQNLYELSFKNTNGIDIKGLGSNGKLPGAATALEMCVAKKAAQLGVNAGGLALEGSYGYHKAIGRKLRWPGSDGGYSVMKSVWTKKQCQDIASLGLV